MTKLLKIGLGLLAFIGLAAVPACEPGFPGTASSQHLQVTLTSTNLGEPTSRLPISFTTPTVFTVDIQALDANGDLDTSFNGYVRASVVPGSVLSVTGPNTNGRNALLKNGQAQGIQIAVLEAYGNTRIWIEDVGYVPADPLANPPPQCANGIDDNHNGEIDYPVDPGCYAANDDTEDGGTYTAGATDQLYFEYPRIADVRGVSNGGSVTPFPNQQLEVNTGWVAANAPKGVVVTGVSSSGFYITDLGDNRGFTSVYAYTYTAPPIMLPCDRLITFGGTAGDFYGFTEMNFPTWSLEEWDPTVRPCLVPPAAQLNASDLATTSPGVLLNLEAALVQVAKSSTAVMSMGTTTTTSTSLHIGAHFGPGLVDQTTYQATAEASDCDYNGDGKIEFLSNCGPMMNAACPENACSTACTADPECSEYSAYLTNSQFRINVTTTVALTGKSVSSTSTTNSIQGNGSADATFDPVQLKGQELGAFSGNLLYFSGGSQFTIQARCGDDIVTDTSMKPLPSDKACVVARNGADQTNGN
jgi:hypothetical protein